MKRLTILFFNFIILNIIFPSLIHADCDCSNEATTSSPENKTKALTLKLAAIFSILIGGAIGVCTPIAGRWVPSLRPDSDAFFVVKSFAAGVILATGFIHILPDAFASLGSPCLEGAGPWLDFPFAGLVAMAAAIGTLAVDGLATGYYKRVHFNKVGGEGKEVTVHDEENGGAAHGGHVHVHTHTTHGHAHGSGDGEAAGASSELIRHRVVSQVLELGIVAHSVIIGVSLGASETASTIKPLVAALTFHQFFEGMGLGGCIVRANFQAKSVGMMVLFFSLTTPIGIAVGIRVSSLYNENSPTALIVEGILNAAAAGILIYMALVDLLAADFMSPRVQSNGWLQLGLNVALLLGAGLMSMLAKWA